MKHRLTYALLAGVGAVVACGELTDPSKAAKETAPARISGALGGGDADGGSEGLRVAVVWRAGEGGGHASAKDVPVVAGRFSLDLDPPPDAYLFAVDAAPIKIVPTPPPGAGADGGTDDWDAGSWEPWADGGTEVEAEAGIFPRSLAPRDNVSGTVGNRSELRVALAGFVVYRDTNGNGRLDFAGDYLTSPDEIVGGNVDLTIRYFAGGGALDYEKLRDRSGVLPHAGFNLGLAVDGGTRWVALDLAELSVGGRRKLPREVCFIPSTYRMDPPDFWGPAQYPSPGDPGLRCAIDGSAFLFDTVGCRAFAPPGSLCIEEDEEISCQTGAERPSPAPADWPCP